VKQVMRIPPSLKNGRLGVNTLSPGAALHVIGAGTITGTLVGGGFTFSKATSNPAIISETSGDGIQLYSGDGGIHLNATDNAGVISNRHIWFN